MHILVTDSGVGGLSVVAYAERLLRTRGFREPVRITFANAAPANDYGYNAMRTREEKLATFDRFLRAATERLAPDSIYVACNTLSVLLPQTPYCRRPPVPVQGIVATAARLLLRELASDASRLAIVFGTQTTIDAGTYPRLLTRQGIASRRIVSQACPGLADTISEDREGTKAAAEITRWVQTAAEAMPDPAAPVVAALACTHYGYRRKLFADAFEQAGIDAHVVDPNERAVDDLFGGAAEGPHREVDVRFVTRYAIPDATVEALTFFLSPISPRTVAAMRSLTHAPDLF